MAADDSINLPLSGIGTDSTIDQATREIDGVQYPKCIVYDEFGFPVPNTDLFAREERSLAELASIRNIDAASYSQVKRAHERVGLTDRRGSTGRGSTR